MANIVKVDSLEFSSVVNDIITYLSKTGQIDLTDFFTDATASRIASAIAGLYKQLQLKLDSVRRESIMNSAIRDESIEYLALSQLNYNPKRKIAPQHQTDHWMTFSSLVNSGLTSRDVISTVLIDDISHSISVIDGWELVTSDGVTNSFKGRLGIGSWRRKEISINESEGHLDSFHIFTVDEDKYVIDDSGTIKVSVMSADGSSSDLIVVDNLYDITTYSDEDLKKLVLVKSNFFGGIDLNFGDGVVFGNMLSELRGEFEVSTTIIVEYFVTPGFIPNLEISDTNVSYDSNLLTAKPVIDPEISNGIDQESADSIKTLSPQAVVSQNRIISPQDMKVEVEKIPTIKSAFVEKEIQEAVDEWVSGVLYDQGSVAKYNDITYVAIVNSISYISPPSNPTQWIALPVFDDRLNNATFLLYALVPKSTPTWSSSRTYLVDQVVIFDEKYWKCLVAPGTTEPSSTSTDWIEVDESSVDQFESLTQGLWELDYFEQYGFNTKLGFMRVVVRPLTAIPKDFSVRIVLNKSVDVQSRSQSEIDSEVRSIINNYMWVVGAEISVGELVSDLLSIVGINKVYLIDPIANSKLSAYEYWSPGTISITYSTEDSITNRYGS